MTSTIEQTAKISPFAPFRRKNFTLLWFADFVSTSGSALTYLAAGILVYEITGSALSIGLMLMATAVPSLLVGLLAGVLVDRYDRKKIMFFSDFSRGLLVLLVPVLAANNIAWLYVIVFLVSTVDKFFQPAHESVLPELAPDEELAAANSFIAISSFGSTAIGFALSGLIASAFDVKWAFYADSITFFVSALLIMFMQVPKLEIKTESSIANVVVEEDATLLRVTADGLRKMMENRELNRVFLSKMTERMARMNMIDMPYISGIDEQSARELRSTPAPAAT